MTCSSIPAEAPELLSETLMVTSPGAMPWTAPLGITLARVGSEDDQTRPEESSGVPATSETEAASCVDAFTSTLCDGALKLMYALCALAPEHTSATARAAKALLWVEFI